SAVVHARGLWFSARFASMLSMDQVCRVAEASITAMAPGQPLPLRLQACRTLGLLCR
ncbi:unnamed protein product, partial [Choristocarpus tenellus]